MSKDLEEGEIEDGELPEELAETSVADDVGTGHVSVSSPQVSVWLNICPVSCRSRVDLQKLPCRKQIWWLQSLTCPLSLSLQQRLRGAL